MQGAWWDRARVSLLDGAGRGFLPFGRAGPAETSAAQAVPRTARTRPATLHLYCWGASSCRACRAGADTGSGAAGGGSSRAGRAILPLRVLIGFVVDLS